MTRRRKPKKQAHVERTDRDVVAATPAKATTPARDERPAAPRTPPPPAVGAHAERADREVELPPDALPAEKPAKPPVRAVPLDELAVRATFELPAKPPSPAQVLAEAAAAPAHEQSEAPRMAAPTAAKTGARTGATTGATVEREQGEAPAAAAPTSARAAAPSAEPPRPQSQAVARPASPPPPASARPNGPGLFSRFLAGMRRALEPQPQRTPPREAPRAPAPPPPAHPEVVREGERGEVTASPPLPVEVRIEDRVVPTTEDARVEIPQLPIEEAPPPTAAAAPHVADVERVEAAPPVAAPPRESPALPVAPAPVPSPAPAEVIAEAAEAAHADEVLAPVMAPLATPELPAPAAAAATPPALPAPAPTHALPPGHDRSVREVRAEAAEIAAASKTVPHEEGSSLDAIARAEEEHEDHAPEPPEFPAFHPEAATLEYQLHQAKLDHEAARDPQQATLAERDAHDGRKAKPDDLAQTFHKTKAIEQVEHPGDESPEEEAGIGQMAERPRHRRDEIVWVLAAAGPVVWFLDLVIAWAVTPAAHHSERLTTLRLIHVGALVLTIVTAVLAVIELRRMPKPAHTHIRDQRAMMFNIAAVVLAVLSILLVLGNLLVTFLLIPGAEP